MATSNRPGMRRYAIAAATLMLLATGAANGQLYRWTDPSGRVHFTDTPPPPNATNVQKKKGGPGPSASSPASAPNDPYVVQQARKTSPVTLYTAPGCEPCGPARKLLNERGVPFKEVSVSDEASAAELQKTFGGGVVPAIVVGQGKQMGFEEGAYNLLLDRAGYPKAGILPPKKPAPQAGATPAVAPPAPR